VVANLPTNLIRTRIPHATSDHIWILGKFVNSGNISRAEGEMRHHEIGRDRPQKRDSNTAARVGLLAEADNQAM
jgi:hypothetical protein